MARGVRYYHDLETSSASVRRRVNAPSIARWTAIDPAWFLGGDNRYVYAKNSPVMISDPSGLLVPILIALLAAAIAGCALPFHEYAHNHYGDSSDKFKHCWVSCRMSRACTGILTQYA